MFHALVRAAKDNICRAFQLNVYDAANELGAPFLILNTHAVVGAAIATLMPDHPGLAFLSGMASHFLIDAIPPSAFVPERRLASSYSRT
jgi:hypothetical protein